MHKLRRSSHADAFAAVVAGRENTVSWKEREQLHERKEWSRLVLFEATANQCQRAGPLSACKYFARNAGLADTGLAVQQDHPSRARGDRLENGHHAAQLSFSRDQVPVGAAYCIHPAAQG